MGVPTLYSKATKDEPAQWVDSDWLTQDLGDNDMITLEAVNGRDEDERHTVELTLAELRTMTLGTGMDQPICSGPCECTVEPDGYCPNGWWSIPSVSGLV